MKKLVKIAAGLLVAQILFFGALCYVGFDRLLQIPAVRELAESFRQERNFDLAWTKFDTQQRVWGYVDRHSIAAGEPIDLMLSVKPGDPGFQGAPIISRIGAKRGGQDRTEVWRGSVETIDAQDLRDSSSSVGAGWKTSNVIDKTEGWGSGYYVVDVLGADGKRDQNVATFVVRPSQRDGDILVKVSTNTFQAYNPWGGHSFYRSAIFSDRDIMVSFDRPTYPEFFDVEVFFVEWLEELAAAKGWRVGYISDFDLHDDPTLLDGYKLFVSHGHDEYWSKEMFDAVENRIFRQGKNVVFLGADTAYWQVRYADLNQAPGGKSFGRQMICYKIWPDPILGRFPSEKEALPYLTEQFRTRKRRPETMLMGVAYQDYFRKDGDLPQYDYKVARTDLPFFEGTGWSPGDTLRGVVGNEWDNRDPDGDGTRMWDPKASMNAELPASAIKVLFSGSPIDSNGKTRLAEAVYWESTAGAKVFASGTIRWDWGFGKPGVEDEKFKIFNRNLFEHLVR